MALLIVMVLMGKAVTGNRWHSSGGSARITWGYAMEAKVEFEFTDRNAVHRALDWGIRYSLSQAAAVEFLRPEGLPHRRTPFRWSDVARFALPPAALVLLETPTAQMVHAEQGNVSAVIHLAVMAAIVVVGWFSLRSGAWSYRQACVAAYYANLDQLTWPNRLMISGLGAQGEDDPPEWIRVQDAQRWARWLTLAALAITILLAFATCTTILDCLWDVGLVSTVHPMTPFAVTTSVYDEILWTLADSIPILDLPSAFQWADPSPFQASLIIDVVLLVVRVAVFGPVIAWIIGAYKGAGGDPREPVFGDKVASRVVRGLNTVDHSVLKAEDDVIIDKMYGDWSKAGFNVNDFRYYKWAHAIDFASKALMMELGEGWSPDRILAYLAANRLDFAGKPG